MTRLMRVHIRARETATTATDKKPGRFMRVRAVAYLVICFPLSERGAPVRVFVRRSLFGWSTNRSVRSQSKASQIRSKWSRLTRVAISLYNSLIVF